MPAAEGVTAGWGRWRRAVAFIAGGIVIALLAWPTTSLVAGPGLDPSWQAVMHLAARRGVDFGTEVNFTYGPLGFLVVRTLYYPSLSLLALLYLLTVLSTLATVVLWSLSRHVRLVVAVAVTYVVVVISALFVPEAILGGFFVVGVMGIRGEVSATTARRSAYAMAAIAALHVLVKFSVGVIGMALAVIVAACVPGGAPWRTRIRPVVTALGVALLTFIVLFFAGGEDPADLVPYTLATLHIAAGYSAAMAIEDTTRTYDYVLLLMALGIFVWLTVGALRGSPRAERVGVAALATILVWGAFKAGFVRHDLHALIFFVVVTVAATAFVTARRSNETLVAVLMLVVMVFHAFGSVPIVFRPIHSVNGFVQEVASIVVPSRRTALIQQGRAEVAAVMPLDDDTLATVRDGTVHVHPWESSLVWAYELDWRPLPVTQNYSAYTEYLDERNAEVLASDDGPDHVLHETPRAIDARHLDWEAPETRMSLLCHYHEIDANDYGQVLARTPNRCGEEKPLGSGVTEPGVPLPVPAASNPQTHVVVARVSDLPTSAVDRLVALVAKSTSPLMVETGDGRTYRVVEGTAGGPWLVRSNAARDETEVFEVDDVESLAFFREAGEPSIGGISVEFFEIELAATP